MSLFTVLQCSVKENLVSDSTKVPDDKITATSEYDFHWSPKYARFSASNNAWCASDADIGARVNNVPIFYIQVGQFRLASCTI